MEEIIVIKNISPSKNVYSSSSRVTCELFHGDPDPTFIHGYLRRPKVLINKLMSTSPLQPKDLIKSPRLSVIMTHDHVSLENPDEFKTVFFPNLETLSITLLEILLRRYTSFTQDLNYFSLSPEISKTHKKRSQEHTR